MAITARTIHTDLLIQLTVASTTADFEVLRYTYATDALSSDYLSTRAVNILQTRWETLTENLTAGQKQAQLALLSQLLYVTEGSGTLSIAVQSYAAYNALAVTGLSADTSDDTFLVHLGVPHSGGLVLSRGIL